ncbi:hypothetical protein T08_13875 [Trichinella sp. T8]|nr:hypothetical protein T08_13875 [Trichinella sp. T8]
MQNNFPNLIAQAKRNISHHLKTPENSKSPCFLESRNLRSSCQNITGRAVILPSPWEGSLALQGGSLFGLSILLLLYVFHVPLRACFPFHGTSLRCVFNRYRDDGHRFIAARWEISQCQVTAAFIVENKVPRLRKSIGLQRWSCAAKNKQVRGNGRRTRCNLEQLIAEAEISTSTSVEIVTHHSIHWHGSGKSIDTWNLGGPVVFSMPLWNVLPSVET